MKISFRDVSFAYEEKEVIDSVSLTFDSGLFYGIIGTNGSGKTTLIDLFCGLIQPVKGTITMDDQPMASLSKRRIARTLSLVPQNFYINFPYTIYEVVVMGRHPYMGRFSRLNERDREIIDGVMKITGIDEFQNRKVTELSGGERQRVLFARALVQDTDIIVLDEATSNLDIRHTLNLLNIVSKKVKDEGKTVVSVFQDINLAALYCDVLIFIESGKIKYRGSTSDILTAKTIQSIFQVNATVYEEPYAKKKHIFFQP